MYSVNFKGYRFLMFKHKCPEFMMFFLFTTLIKMLD